MTILALPSELLIAVLVHLGARDVLSFCCTNRFFRSLLRDSILLQYLVELDASGSDELDNPRALDLVDRLKYVRSRESLWCLAEIGPRRKVSVPVGHDHSHLHALSAGVYVLGDLGLQPDTLRTNSLHYIRLPRCLHSKSLPIGPQEWWAPIPLGIEALSIGISLEEQDLLAVLTSDHDTDRNVSSIRLHLRSFASREDHHRAQIPVISVHEHLGDGNHCVASIQIAGPYLLLLLTWLRSPNTPDELYVYDWMEGRLLHSKSRPGFTYRGVSFLSEDSFVLTDIRQNTLELFRIVRSSNGSGQSTVQDIGKLGLPCLRNGSCIVSMTCGTDNIRTIPTRIVPPWLGEKSPLSISRTHSGSGHFEQAFIRCKSEKALVKFRVYVQGSRPPVPEHVSHFSFVAHRGALLRIAQTGFADGQSVNALTSQALPWHLWGPDHTRWCGIDEADAAWMGSVSGQRQAIVSGNKPRKIRIRDYNMNTVRKHLSGNAKNSQLLSQVVAVGSTVAHQGCFAEDIYSSLPYVELVSSDEYDYDAVQMDDDHIIGVLENEDDGTLRQLDVFVMVPDKPKTCDCGANPSLTSG